MPTSFRLSDRADVVATEPLRFRQECVRNVGAGTLPREHRTLLVRGRPFHKAEPGYRRFGQNKHRTRRGRSRQPSWQPGRRSEPARADFENPVIYPNHLR
jgi:hypothetical protein